MNPLRVVFFGTAELACQSLAALAQSSFCQVAAAVTQPDRPRGRDLKLQPTPVKAEAERWSLPVLQPEKARAEAFIAQLRELAPDLIVVAAYGQILPKAILELPRHGCVNVHTSLLPRYRGAAPIQWAILDDQAETGVTIMKMDAGLDTGDILAMRATPIAPDDNAQTLHDRLARLGAELLVETLPGYISGSVLPRPQPSEGSTYARKITKEDGRVDWSRPARAIWCQIRGLAPWPGAFTTLPAQPRPLLLKLWRSCVEDRSGQPGEVLSADRSGLVIACGEGALRLEEVQREGSRRMTAEQFLLGCPLQPGQILT